MPKYICESKQNLEIMEKISEHAKLHCRFLCLQPILLTFNVLRQQIKNDFILFLAECKIVKHSISNGMHDFLLYCILYINLKRRHQIKRQLFFSKLLEMVFIAIVLMKSTSLLLYKKLIYVSSVDLVYYRFVSKLFTDIDQDMSL